MQTYLKIVNSKAYNTALLILSMVVVLACTFMLFSEGVMIWLYGARMFDLQVTFIFTLSGVFFIFTGKSFYQRLRVR